MKRTHRSKKAFFANRQRRYQKEQEPIKRGFHFCAMHQGNMCKYTEEHPADQCVCTDPDHESKTKEK